METIRCGLYKWNEGHDIRYMFTITTSFQHTTENY